MAESYALLVLLPVVWLMGLLVVYQARSRRKEGARLWEVYSGLARSLGLEAREEVSAGYGLPDLIGRVRGRRVLVHPIVGRGSGGLPKTAYVATHSRELDGRVLIKPPHVSRYAMGEFRRPVHVPGLPDGCHVTAQAMGDEPRVRRMLSPDARRGIAALLERNPDRSLSFILESRTVLFYNRGWDEDAGTIGGNVQGILDVAEALDLGGDGGALEVPSRMFARLDRGSPEVSSDFVTSFFLANIGAVVILISTTRVHAALTMRREGFVRGPEI